MGRALDPVLVRPLYDAYTCPEQEKAREEVYIWRHRGTKYKMIFVLTKSIIGDAVWVVKQWPVRDTLTPVCGRMMMMIVTTMMIMMMITMMTIITPTHPEIRTCHHIGNKQHVIQSLSTEPTDIQSVVYLSRSRLPWRCLFPRGCWLCTDKGRNHHLRLLTAINSLDMIKSKTALTDWYAKIPRI